MEPVIKKSPYHHVLLMRDDKEIISFKVHSKVLRYSLVGGILLVGMGIAGTFFGIKSWQKNHTLKAQYAQTSAELTDARLQLEQLSNLQSLIATCDFPAPVFKFDEIQLPPESDGNDEMNTASPQTPQTSPQSIPAPAETGNEITKDTANSENGANDESSLEAPSQEETSPAAILENASQSEEEEEEEEEETQDNVSSALPITHESSPVSINNLSTKAAGSNRIQMNFDLVANKPDAFVRGETNYAIELNDGTKHQITPNFLDDTRFAISRMKNFDLTATLPKGVTGQEIKSITVQIVLDSGSMFTSSYPFAQ